MAGRLGADPKSIRVTTIKPSGTVSLMGFKGSSYHDSGYFYAPYVPITRTPTVFGEDDGVFGAPTHKKVERYAYDLWQADKKKGDKVRTDSLCGLEDDTRPPDNFERHPEYYWNKAIKDLVSPIAQAVAEEAGNGIIFKPGHQADNPFEYWRRQNDHCFAKAHIDGEAFVINGLGVGGTKRFNLHLEKDTVAMLEYLRNIQQWTYEYDGWPDIPNPCAEIPLGVDLAKGISRSVGNTPKGIITRYGKKLLAQGKKHYSMKTIAELASGK